VENKENIYKLAYNNRIDPFFKMPNAKPISNNDNLLQMRNVKLLKAKTNDLPKETPLINNKPFKYRGKRLDLPEFNEVKYFVPTIKNRMIFLKTSFQLLKIDEDSINVAKHSNEKERNWFLNLSNKQRLMIFILFRFLNGFLVQSWFVADEFWQSQEVAHKLAFK
jgi:hypothetical protein